MKRSYDRRIQELSIKSSRPKTLKNCRWRVSLKGTSTMPYHNRGLEASLIDFQWPKLSLRTRRLIIDLVFQKPWIFGSTKIKKKRPQKTKHHDLWPGGHMMLSWPIHLLSRIHRPIPRDISSCIESASWWFQIVFYVHPYLGCGLTT